VPLLVKTADATQDALVASCREYLTSLARLSRLEHGQELRKPALVATVVVRGFEVHVPLADVIDVNAERQRLQKELAKTEAALERIAKKLSSEAFVAKAPAEVVGQQRATQAELSNLAIKLRDGLAHIEEHVKEKR
jgi:valyl-tRNA synthetase